MAEGACEMTKERTLKRRVRERMAKTGERYATARSHVADKAERVSAARTRLSATDDRPADEKLKAATGRTWDQWFSILDRWGARERTHTETTAFLHERHDVPGWWTQTITVWYQRSRGLRLKHQHADGFRISASKTVAVPVEELFAAFVDGRKRRRWLDVPVRVRTKKDGATARFDWDDGSTRFLASFEAKGPAKSAVAIQHERIADADEAEAMKAAWRQRLTDLKTMLES
jgi:uncharacterized protein YndB with AHSA1/START domain